MTFRSDAFGYECVLWTALFGTALVLLLVGPRKALWARLAAAASGLFVVHWLEMFVQIEGWIRVHEFTRVSRAWWSLVADLSWRVAQAWLLLAVLSVGIRARRGEHATAEPLSPSVESARCARRSVWMWLPLFAINLVLMLLVAQFTQGTFMVVPLGLNVAVLVWMAFVVRDLRALTGGRPPFSPAAAIGFLFIPVFGLYWFFRSMAGILGAERTLAESLPAETSSSRVSVGGAMTLWASAFGLKVFGYGLAADRVSEGSYGRRDARSPWEIGSDPLLYVVFGEILYLTVVVYAQAHLTRIARAIEAHAAADDRLRPDPRAADARPVT